MKLLEALCHECIHCSLIFSVGEVKSPQISKCKHQIWKTAAFFGIYFRLMLYNISADLFHCHVWSQCCLTKTPCYNCYYHLAFFSRSLLYSISADLTEKEYNQMRLYCINTLSFKRRQLEKVKNVFDLFVLLERGAYISPTNTSVLKEMMRSLDCGDLLDLINEYQGNTYILYITFAIKVYIFQITF